jgi:hypothetical protein
MRLNAKRRLDEVPGMMRGASPDKPVALSTIYRMLARNGWRKQAPDTAHAQGGAVAREDWEKNFRRSWTKSSRLGATADRYG